MKKIIALILAAGSMALAGTKVNLAQPGGSDLVGSELVRAATKNLVELPAPHAPLSMSWALDPNVALKLSPSAPEVSSKDFWMNVSGSDFHEGISLNVSQGGALVRISPRQKGASMPHLEDLVLVNRTGDSFSGGRGLERLLDPQQVEVAKNTPFSEGTAIFRLADNLGSGELLLFADNMDYDAKATYTVHVRQLDSDVALTARTARHNYLAGQTLRVDSGMAAGKTDLAIDRMEGRLISPSGRTWPLSFNKGVATWPLTDGSENASMGLWEVHISAFATHQDNLIRRDVRTAFAIGETTALLAGTVEIDRTDKGFVADLDVEVGLAGRYEVRGILMGTNTKGVLLPLAMGHSANWLEAGSGSISLSYDAHLIEESGLKAPFVVKNLSLIHQNRMSLIGQFENGFSFEFAE